MATQPLTATFSVATLDALSRIATPEEIGTLEAVLDLISRGRGKPWQVEYIVEIITRLAESGTGTPIIADHSIYGEVKPTETDTLRGATPF